MNGVPVRFILAEILVLAGGVILPAQAVPASTRISARLKRGQGHSSDVNTRRTALDTARSHPRGEFFSAACIPRNTGVRSIWIQIQKQPLIW